MNRKAAERKAFCRFFFKKDRLRHFGRFKRQQGVSKIQLSCFLAKKPRKTAKKW